MISNETRRDEYLNNLDEDSVEKACKLTRDELYISSFHRRERCTVNQKYKQLSLGPFLFNVTIKYIHISIRNLLVRLWFQPCFSMHPSRDKVQHEVILTSDS